MPFNRVIKHFVIQAGDNQKAGATEDWTSRGKHNNHLDTRLVTIFEKIFDILLLYLMLVSSDT
jgi:cyclophilin family peptidyl-prolyl cis-trans isomerase